MSNLEDLIVAVRLLVDKLDGLVAHNTAIDADHDRILTALSNHNARIERLERDHNVLPTDDPGKSSGLYRTINFTKPEEPVA